MRILGKLFENRIFIKIKFESWNFEKLNFDMKKMKN